MWYKIKRILVGTNQVRPSWWTPWANTIAYYPLTENLNDYSGHWYNWSFSSWTITYQNGYATLNSASITFNGSNWYKYNDNLTICYWWRRKSTWNIWISIWWWNWPSPYDKGWWLQIYSYSSSWWIWAEHVNYTSGSTPSNYSTGIASFDTTNRHLWVVTYNNSTQKMTLYINLQQVKQVSAGSWTRLPYWAIVWQGWSNWDMSNIIFENKARTAQEISEYYNQTKSNYWL